METFSKFSLYCNRFKIYKNVQINLQCMQFSNLQALNNLQTG